jgi:hypothetical protein
MKSQKAQKACNGHTPRLIRIEFNRPIATAIPIAGTFIDWQHQLTKPVAHGLNILTQPIDEIAKTDVVTDK